MLTVSAVGDASAFLLTFCNDAKARGYTAIAHCYAYALAVRARRSAHVRGVVRWARCLACMRTRGVLVGTSGATVRVSIVPNA